jgi:hypothetical protein
VYIDRFYSLCINRGDGIPNHHYLTMRAFSYILFSIVAASLANAQEPFSADTSDFGEDRYWEKILETAIQADENSIVAEETTQP